MAARTPKGAGRPARWLAAALAIVLALSLVVGIVMLFFYY